MRPEPIVVTFYGEEFKIRPLTLRQLRPIELALNRQQPTAESALDSSYEILRCALERDHAEVAANILDLEASASDVAAACNAILLFGGFRKDGPEGEA